MKRMRLVMYFVFFSSAMLLLSVCLKREEILKRNVDNNGTENINGLFINSTQSQRIRNIAVAALHTTNKKDYNRLSYLYNIIGKSYENSFHFDSAVHYAKFAYEASLELNNKNLQMQRGADLLKLYNQSVNYLNARDSLSAKFDRMDKSSLPVPTRVAVLNALAITYINQGQYELCIYTFSSGLNLYKEYLKENAPDYNDSVNISICNINLGDAYVHLSYRYADNVYVAYNQLNNEMQYYREGRKWIGKNNCILAIYYYRLTEANALLEAKNLPIAKMYKDSLVSLTKVTGFNFNDLLLKATITFSDFHYFHLHDNKATGYLDSCWKYRNEAALYDTNLINPANSSDLEWLTGDLFYQGMKYKPALAILKPLLYRTNHFIIRQKKQIVSSIAQCYEGLGIKDSAMLYYKTNILFADSLSKMNNLKVIEDAQIKFQHMIKEHQVKEQHVIIEYANKQRTWFFVGIALLLCLVILLVIIYRNKRTAANRSHRQNIVLNNLNQQLNEANQTKSRLFAIISHDLRSPIVQLYQLLKLQESKIFLLNPGKKREYDQQIQDATLNLLDRMEDLLVWSKTQMQSFTVVKSPVDVGVLFRQCTDLMMPLIRSKQLKIDNRIAPGIIIETDANFLLAILRNVLHNAIKASLVQGSIIIDETIDDNYKHSFRIINHGAAFTQQDYMKILTEVQTSQQLWRGMGLQIIDELSRRLSTKVLFEALDEETTCCTITLN